MEDAKPDKRRDEFCHILSLPIELQTQILSYLDTFSQIKPTNVCRMWSEIMRSAPEIVDRRYTHKVDDYTISDTVQIHELFAMEDVQFLIGIDFERGSVVKWMARHNYKSQYQQSVHCLGDGKKPLLRLYGDDLENCPFLDDAVISMKPRKFAVDTKTMIRGPTTDTTMLNMIQIFSPNTFSLTPWSWVGERCGLNTSRVSWEIGPGDFAPAAPDNEPGGKPDFPVDKITIRELVELLVRKLKVEIDAIGSKNSNICTCHNSNSGEEAHPSWKGHVVEVELSAGCFWDNAWCIYAFARNPAK